MFRNILISIPQEDSCASFYEVRDEQIVSSDLFKILPCSNDYSLKDLLGSGVKVSPVDPTVIHDSASTLAVARDFVDNYVEPSNSNE